MRSWRFLILCTLLSLPVAATAQIGIRGQIFLPTGGPVGRNIRFTLTTDNGTRHEQFYTDSHGRIALPDIRGNYTITVESDGQTYDTTRVTFYPPSSGNYIVVNLRPLRSAPSAPSTPTGTVDITAVDQGVSAKAKEAYNSALDLLKAEKFEEAVESLKRAIEHQPNYFHAYNDLGVAYIRMKQLDMAADALRHAIKINDRIHLPQLNLGIVLNRQRKYKEAAEVLMKLKASHPDLDSVHAPLIEALIESQQWAKAEESITKALSLKNADAVDLKVKQGTVMIRQGKFPAALSPLREAVAAEPDNALAHLNLGIALMETGGLDEAERSLRRAYEIEGAKMAGSQLMLGQVYFRKKEYARAIEAFEAYLKDFPEAPNAAQVKDAIAKLRQALTSK